MNYYNENDPKTAAWLRELVAAKLIPAGKVDDRSIHDVSASDLFGFTQCHFFAGIGGWSLALQFAGWPEDREVWTGSCPCQPFSCAGEQRGFSDNRHLWPEWFRLISECRPSVIFGEQVARAGLWLDQVFSDLESEVYACAAADIPAIGIGCQHVRHRLWFVADANSERLEGIYGTRGGIDLQPTTKAIPRHDWKANPEVLRRVDGVSHRLDRPPDYKERIRALGNAIVPQVAAEFIAAYLDY